MSGHDGKGWISVGRQRVHCVLMWDIGRLSFRGSAQTLTGTTVYRSDRNTNFVDESVIGTDTTVALSRDARGQRDWGATVSLSPSALATTWFGAASDDDNEDVAQLRSVLSAVRPLSATYRDGDYLSIQS